MKIFVYGTLKRGERLDVRRLIANARFIQDDCIEGYTLHMVDGTGFPAAVRANGKIVCGEVWDIPEEGIALLDRIEGAPIMYAIVKCMTERGLAAHVYIWNNAPEFLGPEIGSMFS